MMKSPLFTSATLHFLAVVRTGSITEAAELVDVAPSAVSRQISKLEEWLGAPLFERQVRGMVLTANGERLAEWARASLLDAERAMHDIRTQARERSDSLRLACTEGLAASFVPRMMASCRADHPRTTIHLRVGTGPQVSAWLLEGEVDLGLKFAQATEGGLYTEFCGGAPIIAAVSPRHPVSRRQRLGLNDLFAQPLAIPGMQTSIHEALDRCCLTLGRRYEEAFTGNLNALMWLAIEGKVLMLASSLAVDDAVHEGKLKILPIHESEFEHRRMYLFSLAGRQLPDAARGFVGHVRRAYAQPAPGGGPLPF